MYLLVTLVMMILVYIASFKSEFDKDKMSKASLFIGLCLVGLILAMVF